MADRFRLSRAKGWKMPAGSVSCARPGRWGNPFVVGRDGTREQCVAKFMALSKGFIAFTERHVSVDDQIAFYRRIRRSVDQLKGLNLGCWCALDGRPCHADILIALANRTNPPQWALDGVDVGKARIGMMAREFERRRKRKARAALERLSDGEGFAGGDGDAAS